MPAVAPDDKERELDDVPDPGDKDLRRRVLVFEIRWYRGEYKRDCVEDHDLVHV